MTIDEILDITCDVMRVRKDDVVSKRRIDITHQAARIIACRIAAYEAKAANSVIGKKINRARENVWYYVNKGTSATQFEYKDCERAIMKKLKEK